MASVRLRRCALCATKPFIESKKVPLKFCSTMMRLCHGPLNFDPGPPGAQQEPPRHPQGARSLQNVFAKSTNVTNRCCHICFSDDKNVFGIITRTPRGHSGAQKGPGGHTKSRSNEKMLLINFVAYASVMTKMHLGSPLNP